MSRQSLKRNIQWSAVYSILKMNESTITAEKLSVMTWLLELKYEWVHNHCRKTFTDELTITFQRWMSRQSLHKNFQWRTDYYIFNINESTLTAEKYSVIGCLLHFKNEWVDNHCRKTFSDELTITFSTFMRRQSLQKNFQSWTDLHFKY